MQILLHIFSGCRVEQRAELVWHDQVAAAVAQSQQPVGSRMFMRSGDAVNSTLFPLWAAGLTGAGMVVGIGDSGLGACCYCVVVCDHIFLYLMYCAHTLACCWDSVVVL